MPNTTSKNFFSNSVLTTTNKTKVRLGFHLNFSMIQISMITQMKTGSKKVSKKMDHLLLLPEKVFLRILMKKDFGGEIFT